MLQVPDALLSASHRNHLLRSLDADDFAALVPLLEPVRLQRGAVLIYPDEVIQSFVFPDDGVASVVTTTDEGHRAEVGLFGREGMSGISLLLGVDRSPCETFMQIAGHGWKVRADELLPLLDLRPALRRVLLRHVQAFITQISSTALANGTCSLEQRLARWLLMCHDRVDGNELRLTHEFLGVMLAVRRSGVTEATQKLEASGIISAKRGRITILDRQGLITKAGAGYGAAEAEYERLVGTGMPDAPPRGSDRRSTVTSG